MAKILLVEDDEMNRDMLSRRLIRGGYEVVLAHDGAEALESARTSPPDLILMDLRLPVMDGWEASRKLKSDALTMDIPIIALTADAFPEDEQKARLAGCDDYDTKPVDIVRLVKKIEHFIRGEPANG